MQWLGEVHPSFLLLPPSLQWSFGACSCQGTGSFLRDGASLTMCLAGSLLLV